MPRLYPTPAAVLLAVFLAVLLVALFVNPAAVVYAIGVVALAVLAWCLIIYALRRL